MADVRHGPQKLWLIIIYVATLAAASIVSSVFASDVWDHIRANSAYSLTAAILVLLALITLQVAIEQRKLWPAIVSAVLLLTVASLVGYALIYPQKLKGSVGEWLHDDYVGVLIPHATIGTLISEEHYDLTVELENRTSIPLEITKIEVEKYNHEAALVVGKKGDLIHSSTYNDLKYINANDRATVSIPGNQLLPKTAIVKIYHTLSGQPSIFEINLGAKRMPMPRARRLPLEVIYRGTDALNAITEASKLATTWGTNVTLVAAFPGDHKTYIDPETRLKYVEVGDWVVTFYSLTLKQLYMAIVIGDKARGGGFAPDPGDTDLPDQVVDLPQLGDQRALAIANKANLLCANGQADPRLETIKVNGAWRAAWFLAYVGPDSLPVIIDATTGGLIRLSGSNGFVE